MSKSWDIPLSDGRIATHHRQDEPDGRKKVWWMLDGSNGLDGMSTASLPLYATDRLASVNASEAVVVCEGEKATDALLERGVVAVGTVTGANGTPSDESLNIVRGRTVILWADNDALGTKHMDAIAARLFKLGANDVREVEWTEAPHKGDAADFTGDDEHLLDLIQSAIPLERPDGDLATLLNDICAFINKYVVLMPTQLDTLALWVLHTWTFSPCDTTAYISISSPEKGSGKTRTFQVLEQLVRKPMKLDGASPSVLFRAIDQDMPTLLFDEVDATFKGDKEAGQAIRQILNAGSVRGGRIARTGGGNFEVQYFDVFCPKAFAGIGKDTLPDTVIDRSIPIELKRKIRREQTTRLRHRKFKDESAPLRERIEAWAEYNEGAVAEAITADPYLPETLSDRAADGWEPLFAIADLASSEWGGRARASSRTLMNSEDDASIGVILLTDIAAVFKARNHQVNISTKDLIKVLTEMDEAPWSDWHGRPITSRGLSQLLKAYGIKSRSVRIGDQTPKGYRQEDFADAWSRYTPELSATAQHPGSELESAESDSLGTSNVADTNSLETGQIELDVADVAVKAGFTAERSDHELYMNFVGDHNFDDDELLV